jgi:hypothetical protein
MRMIDIQTLQNDSVQNNLLIPKLKSKIDYLNLSEKVVENRPKMLTYYTGLETFNCLT